MIQSAQLARRRGPTVEALIFKMGGFNGMVRRVIGHWRRPFTANQVKVAVVRLHPELIPGRFQVEDILTEMVRLGKLERMRDGTYRHVEHEVAPPKFIKARISKRKQQLKFIFGK